MVTFGTGIVPRVMRWGRASGLFVIAVLGLTGCAVPEAGDAAAPLADAAPPANEWEAIGQRALLQPGALGAFELAPQQDYSATPEPAECQRFDELDERYGAASTLWGIGFRRPPTSRSERVFLGQNVAVWADNSVAERRVLDAVEVLGPCRRASISQNFEAQTEAPIELVDATLLDLDLPAIDDVVIKGYRIRLDVDTGGLQHYVYYDFAYLGHGHAISVVTLAATVRPLPPEERDHIVRLAGTRLREAQS